MRSVGLACAVTDFFTENDWFQQSVHFHNAMRYPRVSLTPEILKRFCSSVFWLVYSLGVFTTIFLCLPQLHFHSACLFLVHSSFSWRLYTCSALLALTVFFIFLDVSVEFFPGTWRHFAVSYIVFLRATVMLPMNVSCLESGTLHVCKIKPLVYVSVVYLLHLYYFWGSLFLVR